MFLPQTLTLLLPLFPALAQEGEEIQRPKYAGLPQNRDWSILRGVDRHNTDDWWDRYKFIPLNESGSIWIGFGGQLRSRVEYWNNFNFGVAPPGVETTDTFWLNRVLFHADLHVGENFRTFGEFKGAWVTSRELAGGARTIDQDDADLQQLFFDYTFDVSGGSRLTLRPGRQAFSFGKQRLISRLPWGNTLRAWDGASAIWKQSGWTATGLWAQFAPVLPYDFNVPNSGSVLYGLYAENKVPDRSRQHDLYVLGIDRNMVTFNGTSGEEQRLTVGTRVSDKDARTGLGGELEGGYQFGSVGSGNISAWFLAAVADYSFELARLPSKLFVGYDYASGDDSPGGNVGTFNQMFPLGHAYLGFIDIVGRQNIVDYHAGMSSVVAPRTTARVAYHHFELATSNDALYNAGGGVVVPGGTSGSRNVGGELDLTVKWDVTRHFNCLLGYSHFFPSTVPQDAGLTEDTDFAYLQLQYDF